MMFMFFSFLTFLFSLISLILSMHLFSMSSNIFMEWNLISINSTNFNFMFFFDWISLIYISIVLMISSMVIIYSMNYMKNDIFQTRFIFLLILFILSMILMISMPNIFSIMIGWDGLGLISFCLVIFYQNKKSFNNGMITILSNRIGDISILIILGMNMSLGSWNLMLFNNIMFSNYFILLASMTKSAQFPFSSWLPAAMSAPTPISALVHSSTLVTAGIYLMIRYYPLMNNKTNEILLIISSITMFYASLNALNEFDLKKIIAFSTLSQLALMMSSISMNMWKLAFFHLLNHAIYKSLLFLCAGSLIHNMNNNQDIRTYGGLMKIYPLLIVSILIAIMSLCGFPFLTGFFSKDKILELSFNFKNLPNFLMIMSSILTVSYSFRLMFFLFFNNILTSPYNNNKENLSMNLPLIILILCSIFSGAILQWMFFFNLNNIFIKYNNKMFINLIFILGITLSIILFKTKPIFSPKLNFIFHFLSSISFLNSLVKKIYQPFMLFSNMNFYFMEKGWIEYNTGMLSYNFIKYSKMNFSNKFNTLPTLKFFFLIIILFSII